MLHHLPFLFYPVSGDYYISILFFFLPYLITLIHLTFGPTLVDATITASFLHWTWSNHMTPILRPLVITCLVLCGFGWL